jgi:hypothetical protein
MNLLNPAFLLVVLLLASCTNALFVDPKIAEEKEKAKKCLEGSQEHMLIYNCGIVDRDLLGQVDRDLTRKVLKKLSQAKEQERLRARDRDRWRYTQIRDDSSGKYYKEATIQSENVVNLSFPYEGSQHATFALRRHPRYGEDAFMSIERGQILCNSYANSVVILRADSGPVRRFGCAEPADNSSETVFLRDFSGTEQLIKSAKTLYITVTLHQEGDRTFEFKVQHYDGSKI